MNKTLKEAFLDGFYKNMSGRQASSEVKLFSKLEKNCSTEINQIVFVASLHEWGVPEHIYSPHPPPPPHPLPVKGSKGQITVKFSYKVDFIFLCHILHIYSAMVALLHIDGILVVSALGVTLRGSVGVKN